MSISPNDTDLETAVAQANAGANTEEENAIVLEASEDRSILALLVSQTQGNMVVETTFSNRFELNADGAQDDIASGVLHVTRNGTGGTAGDTDYVVFPDGHQPQWDAGEELNVHVNNFSADEHQVRVVVYYAPLGDFQRDRLRNR